MDRLPILERRAQLVRAALVVATRDGFEAATVRAIAAEAGVSLGVVHYCFEDKDELLREVARGGEPGRGRPLGAGPVLPRRGGGRGCHVTRVASICGAVGDWRGTLF